MSENPYERKNSEPDGLDIPDFIEDTSTGPDMSIFKMSDEELYDDVTKTTKTVVDDKTDEDYEYEKPKKSGKALLVVCMIILLLVAIGATVFGLKEHKAYVKANTENLKLVDDKQKADKQIADLQAQLDAYVNEKKKQEEEAAKQKVYVVLEDEVYFRNKPATYAIADRTMYNGTEETNAGDEFVALEVVKGIDDPKLSFIKVAEDVYLCIGSSEESYAKVKE